MVGGGVSLDSAIALYKLGEKWSIKGALQISMFLFFITPILAFLVRARAFAAPPCLLVLSCDSFVFVQFLRGPDDQYYFFLVAIPAGTAIGGTIALTRTMYAGIIPKSQEAEVRRYPHPSAAAAARSHPHPPRFVCVVAVYGSVGFLQ